MAAFEDFDLTDRQRVDKRILHWGGTTRLFQIGMTIEKPCVRSYSRCARAATDRCLSRAGVGGSCATARTL
jgi:hypothetical protein